MDEWLDKRTDEHSAAKVLNKATLPEVICNTSVFIFKPLNKNLLKSPQQIYYKCPKNTISKIYSNFS